MRLIPVYIAKPWGQEIWYTGMESRGVSRVALADGTMPLDTYLASDLDRLCDNTDVLLLKILDPAPAAVQGDLYFEVHQNKQEVYVVTHVDEGAWPDGQGAIRFGMSQSTRRQYPDDSAFRRAFLEAVQTYEVVRRRIDAGQAQPDDAEQEVILRNQMEAFTDFQPLSVADVVKVPTWTPHALQHGVRVVEFQTATYERFIISFAQQVVTQDHWDSAHAIANMQLDTPQAAQFVQIGEGVEQIVTFDDFNAWRCRGNAASFVLPSHLPYAVCMAIEAGPVVGDLALDAEEACFVPRKAIHNGANIHTGGGTLLIAAPGL